MNRKEAIRTLEKESCYECSWGCESPVKCACPGCSLIHAVNVAIEALEEMPVEEYRQRLMEVFHRTDHDELLTYVVMPKEEEFKSLENILLQYEYEPRPHGEWIYDVFDENYHCSECGKECGSPYDFCPNCGSDNRPKEGERNEFM